MKRYDLKGKLDFSGTEAEPLNPLVERALAAINSGAKQFREVVNATDDGQPIRLYLDIEFQGDVPTRLEIGIDLDPDDNVVEATRSLPAEYGRIGVSKGEPLATAPIIRLRWYNLRAWI